MLSLVFGGLTLLALGVVFVLVVLDAADTVATVLGLFFALVGLGLCAAGARQTERAEKRRRAIAEVGVNRATKEERASMEAKGRERTSIGNNESCEEQPGGYYSDPGRRPLPGAENRTKALDFRKGGPAAIESY